MSILESTWETAPTRPSDEGTIRRDQRHGDTKEQNVADIERLASAAAGACLVAAGLYRRNVVGLATAAVGAALVQRGLSGRCAVYQALGINTRAESGTARRRGVRAKRGRRHESTIVICRPANALFDFWRALHNLPKLFDHLVSVVDLGDGRSHWVARGPLGGQVEWDAEIHQQKPGELIAWRSVAGSDLDTAGSIHFRSTPGNQRTIVTLNMKYDPPAGKIGDAIATSLGSSVTDELEEGLRRFRQIAETGEAASVRDQPHGSCR
jgi:uncharacterized membrane protein